MESSGQVLSLIDPSSGRSDTETSYKETDYINNCPKGTGGKDNGSARSSIPTRKLYSISLGTLDPDYSKEDLFVPKNSNKYYLKDHYNRTCSFQDHQNAASE